MPRYNGHQVVNACSRLKKGIIVAVLTGSNDFESCLDLFGDGAFCYINKPTNKPVNNNALKYSIDRMIEHLNYWRQLFSDFDDNQQTLYVPTWLAEG